MQCDVCGGVIYISNQSKYLKTDVRYARVVPIFIISNVLSNKRVFFKPKFSFHIPLKIKCFTSHYPSSQQASFHVLRLSSF